MHPIIDTILAGITWAAVIIALIWLALIIIRDALQRGDEQFERENPPTQEEIAAQHCAKVNAKRARVQP